ncbi:asparagine synthase (glutamine-hydrolyzing) [Christiangramia sabulilitoris]|uniref:asparagine synthase (glutamine-hydrolyzing) n=1 Tax=Christiangramia sabulilitoris TaxID=2583991 RepID=A0A550HYU0_9FLAO|nr:asparagine synthase (glutamine-hydrolyzing) [Christiangramia sabulilitoris]TRO63902.1 asparagine synthase (glutamine-hydrolyzing) [Christiangramia sabulilitoris]
MCGIAGIVGPEIKKSDLDLMLTSMAHRGSDARGVYHDKGFAIIGHNRLSIIDISHEADQPFSDPTGRYHLSFNGEIYNYTELRNEIGLSYTFKTSSDTEVLLAAYLVYGKNCLEKFRGMFSFMIWDNKEKSLFAARDRFGVKPFFYSNTNDFIFASEIKAIKRIKGSTQNVRQWANYFCYGSYGLPSETFFQDIHQLPAGHYLQFQDESLRIEKWYDFPERISFLKRSYSEDEIKQKYLELLKDSIKLRFRADVPLGFNISGGVDSSLLLTLVNNYHSSEKIKAFTFFTGDERYDELPWIKEMISQTGNPLEKVKLSSYEVPEYASLISEVQDEPFGGIPTLAYAKIFEKAKDSGIKVLLDGQGMDEQWAGYDYYKTKDNSIVQGTGKSGSFKPHVLAKEFRALALKPNYPRPFESSLQNLQYRDLFYTKLPRALRFNDRISMAFSTELREPFLDHLLVEYAFALPDEMKIKNGVHKYMLRELTGEFVPFKIAEAPKRALQTPQREWLGGELREYVERRLSILQESKVSDWFDFKSIYKEWEDYQKGDKQNSFYLWQWINASLIFENS